MGLYPGDSPGNYVKGDVFMDLSVVNTELLQKNFKQMSHEMRRHLAMHLSFFHSSEKRDTLSDPLFQLSTYDLKLFYELNKYLYPVDVQNRLAVTTRTVLLLDEVDKCQPSAQAALLDLLDGHRSYFEQYLRCDIDVRQTVFVLTANDLSLLSPILRDRCEIIAMKGYTWEEKLEIARQVMLPAALKKYGMPPDALPEPLVKDFIRQYCLAPGCRDLEGGLLRLCEAWLLRRVEGNNDAADPALLKTLFGSPLELPDDYPAAPENTVGIVRTLAVAQNAAGASLGVSGAVQVLLTARPGITITGHVEEGLRESVLTALAVAENAAGKALPDGHGIHIHFCGDGPKDGTSAGCTIALAIISLLLSQPIPRTAAFTSTIDLLGCIGRVGGIREKCEAALAAGCTQVFLPAGNRDDLPQELKEQAEAQGAEILFADTIGQMLEKVLCQTSIKAR